MRREWYGRDTGLSARMFITLFLLAVVYLAFLAVMLAAGLDYTLMFLIAFALLGAQYFFSDKLVLWTMGAREVSAEEAPELHGTIERLVALADLPKPRIAVVESSMPNAFATGRSPHNAVVAVTTGLMERLEQPEVEAVLAHELSHIRNRDVMVMTLASFFSTVAYFLMRIGLSGGGRRDRGGGAAAIFIVSILVWIISFFLIRALSRYRELAADRGAAIITGAPSQLASALIKISGTMQRIPQRDLREVEGMNAFFILPAAHGSSRFELFSTHPSLERRLERLKSMEQEMERR